MLLSLQYSQSNVFFTVYHVIPDDMRSRNIFVRSTTCLHPQCPMQWGAPRLRKRCTLCPRIPTTLNVLLSDDLRHKTIASVSHTKYLLFVDCSHTFYTRENVCILPNQLHNFTLICSGHNNISEDILHKTVIYYYYIYICVFIIRTCKYGFLRQVNPFSRNVAPE